MTDEVVVFACQHIKCSRNTTPFQRSSAVCDSFDTHILSRGEVCDEVAAESEKTISVGNGPVQRLLYPLFIIAYVFAIHRSHDVRCVHTTHPPQTLAAGAFLQLIGFVWIADIWDDPRLGVDLDRSESITRRIARGYNRALFSFAKRRLGRADLIVFALAPELLSEYGIAPDAANVYTTTNGVDPTLVPTTVGSDERESVSVVYVGPVLLERGIGTLLDAVTALPKDCPPLSITLVGEANKETREAVSEWQENTGDHTVRLTGRLSHDAAMEHLRTSDIGVCLLSTEVRNYNFAYPIKVFEYMAAGVAIVCTRTVGTEQILNDGENGLLVESDDTDDVADALSRLVREEELRSRLSSEAQKTVREYRWSEINESIIAEIRATTGSSVRQRDHSRSHR
ncbi:glycosyltransferase family 4 protein [Halostella sp. PRR32]|uniref:glycosyltransferase family 4 protein n=1 Tax=Halostella sp. PRR32 TaxID=3098147 RepID=UPI002B1CE3EB|nr:glycosyltransferase family 4 protein [Halostella sp. PRR32]